MIQPVKIDSVFVSEIANAVNPCCFVLWLGEDYNLRAFADSLAYSPNFALAAR